MKKLDQFAALCRMTGQSRATYPPIIRKGEIALLYATTFQKSRNSFVRSLSARSPSVARCCHQLSSVTRSCHALLDPIVREQVVPLLLEKGKLPLIRGTCSKILHAPACVLYLLEKAKLPSHSQKSCQKVEIVARRATVGPANLTCELRHQ